MSRTPGRSAWLRPSVALATVLAVAGCSTGGLSPSVPASGPSGSPDASGSGSPGQGAVYQRYVALGDSYSAGPLIPTTSLAGGCARSDHNYPSLLAGRLDVRRLVDVTCSGATTHDLTHVQPTFGDARIPAQLSSLNRHTDLVTIGIGGNDLDLFSTLIQTCTQLRATDPTGAPCARRLATRGPDLQAATRTISTRVATSLREIRRRAPRAMVVLVGYLRLVPRSGTCGALPLATGDYAEGRRISSALDGALRRAARTTDTRFVDMYAASRGHDVCSEHPWVNGAVTDRTKALAYHPLLAGMRADADGVQGALAHPR